MLRHPNMHNRHKKYSAIKLAAEVNIKNNKTE